MSRKLRKLFVGHPSAILFSRISREGVFQQPQAIAQACAFRGSSKAANAQLTLTLKNAALLALIGTILMTALLVWSFVSTFLNVLRGLVPAVTLFSSFIYAFGCFSVAVFFYVFHRAQ